MHGVDRTTLLWNILDTTLTMDNAECYDSHPGQVKKRGIESGLFIPVENVACNVALKNCIEKVCYPKDKTIS